MQQLLLYKLKWKELICIWFKYFKNKVKRIIFVWMGWTKITLRNIISKKDLWDEASEESEWGKWGCKGCNLTFKNENEKHLSSSFEQS